jgi:hypothetical protein
MSLPGQFNSVQWNSTRWNGLASSISTPGFKIIYNQRDVTLDWVGVSGATHYQVQVSLYHDFRTIFYTTIIAGQSFVTFTDAETDDAKRFWRWRPSSNAGLTYMEPWSEVGSYWLDTAAVEEVTLTRNNWGLVDPDDVIDRYVMSLFPRYQVTDKNLFRIQERNRLGELLSEFLTIKGVVSLYFDGKQFLEHQQFHEMVRFHNDIRTVFLIAYKDGEHSRPMPHVWKVEFMEDPTFTMMATGRQDLLTGQLTFEEV